MIKKVLAALLLTLFLSCKKSIEKQIADEFVIVDEFVNKNSFHFLDNILVDKDIVILGEVGHGDGKTFEIKSRLVEYLIENHGYTTLAMEGVGFLDSEILNRRNTIDSLISFNNLEQWKPWWGHSNKTSSLISFMKNNKFDYLGLEGNSHASMKDFLIYHLNKYYQVTPDKDEYKTINKFEEIYDLLYSNNAVNATKEQLDFFKTQMSFIEVEVKSNLRYDDLNKDVLTQNLKNISINMDLLWYYHIIGGYEGENKYVNIRDEQMADNLIWYKERNPEKKIIVWIANFHGAKNIDKIRYKKDDPYLYDSYTLFNDYLEEKYSNKVYSLAFTSSIGEVQELFKDQTPIEIKAPENTLEFELKQKDLQYGYLDFNEINRKKPNLSQVKFNSILLGYDKKPGLWMSVFDGIFYVRKQEPAAD